MLLGVDGEWCLSSFDPFDGHFISLAFWRICQRVNSVPVYLRNPSLLPMLETFRTSRYVKLVLVSR